MTQPEQEGQRPAQASVAVHWSGVNDKPPLDVNQFVAQLGVPTRDGTPDGLYLLLGSVMPPLIFGKDQATQQREIEAVGSVPVTVYGRFHFSRARLGELIDVLSQAAENYDNVVNVLRGATSETRET